MIQNVQRSRPVKTRSDSQTKQHYQNRLQTQQNASIGEIVDPYTRLYFNFKPKMEWQAFHALRSQVNKHKKLH